MEQNECWCLLIYKDREWRFSSKKLAERAIKLFELEEEDYNLYTNTIFDDEELLDEIAERERLKNA